MHNAESARPSGGCNAATARKDKPGSIEENLSKEGDRTIEIGRHRSRTRASHELAPFPQGQTQNPENCSLLQRP